MKQLKTKTKLVARFLFVAILGLSVLSGCRAYDKDIDKLDADIVNLDKGLNAKLDALKAETQASLDAKVNELKGDIADLTSQITALKDRVANLEKTSATKEELDAAKADLEGKISALENDLMSKLVTLAAFNEYKEGVSNRFAGLDAAISAINAQLASITTELGKKADKTEIARIDSELVIVNKNILDLNNKLNDEVDRINAALASFGADLLTLEGRVDKLDGHYTNLKGLYDALKLLVDNHSDQLAQQNVDIKGLEELLAGLEVLVNSNIDRLDAMDILVAAMQGDINEVAEKAGLNASEIAALQAAFADHEAALGLLTGRVGSLETGLSTLEEAFDALEAIVLGQGEKIAGLTTGLADLTTFVNDLKDEINQKLADHDSKFDDLDATILVINTTLGSHDARLATLEALIETKASKQDVQDLEDALRTLIEENKEDIENKLAAAVTTLNETIDALAIRVSDNEREIRNLKNDVTGLRTDLNNAVDRLTTAEENIEDLIEDLVIINGRLDGLDQDIIDANLRIDDVDGRLVIAEGDIILIKGRLDAVEGRVTNLESALETLEARVSVTESRLDAVEGRADDLEARMDDAEANITDIYSQIGTINTRLDGIDQKIIDANKRIDDLQEAMNLKFFNFSRRLTSLVYVADLYVNGVEAMKFSTLGYDCDGADVEITKDLEIQYRLNPSTVTAEDIDTEGLYFDVRKSTNIVGYLGALPNEEVIKANFVSIVDGVLTVSVSIEDFDAIFGDTQMTYNPTTLTFSDKFTQVSLVVPMSEKVLAAMPEEFENLEEASVAAEYVRLYREVLSADDLDLAMLDEEGELVEPLALLVDNAEDAKDYEVKGVDGATASDPQVVVLPYADGEVDLVEWVTTVLGADEFEDFDAFGLVYNFDLLDENGDAITYERNGINQQQFITIEDGVAVRNDDIEQSVISASLGRTPIVRVWVSEAGKDCPILIGFIKVYVEEEPLPPVVVERECEEPVEFSTLECEQFCYEGCEELPAGEVYDSREVVVEILEKTNFVFDADDEGSIQDAFVEFKGLYTELVYSEGAEDRIKEVGDHGAYEWCVPAADILLALLEKNPATISDTLTFQSEYPALYPDVKLVFTQVFTIDAVNLPLGNLIAEYWYDMDGGNNGAAFDEVKHNIFVPVAGDNDPVNAVFETDLGSAFLQDASLNLKDIPATYEFFFLENQPIVDGMDDPLVVSADGKKLLNPDDLSEVVAEIHERNNADGEVLELKEDSDLAKELLNLDKENLRARIGMRYMPCPDILDAEDNEIWLPVTINNKESFDVVFVRPISASGVSPENFIDGPAYGVAGTYIDVASLVSLYDWRNYSFEDPSSGNDLYEYYDVKSISIDVSEIETDLNQAGAGRVNLQTTFPSLQVKTEATMAGNTPDHGFLTYKNNGVVIGSDFHLFVPVTIEYKWGEIVATEVVVTVKKTIGPSGVIKK